ncbi:glycosyltransferase family 2 protein [Candidatus Peregrinibacteria bacterium]|nr:glycosyltransferase family 2 protein [Candidatus Peregrinibacteria bacterium]MBI3816636.1 glycosyltransferase family 2 protein [Candidatus Peregrinibacteria bacterium]
MIITVIPAYNEATHLQKVVEAARERTDRVVVVDDGSTDDTARVAAASGAIVVRHLENSGTGAATMTGIEAARSLGADTIVTLDADGQHDPADIALLLHPVAEDSADIVFANRFGQRNRIPLIRRVFNGIGNIVTFVTTGRWVQDSQCGFKVFGKRAVREIDLRMSGFECCTEIVREAAAHRWRIAEIPTKVLYSEYTLAKGQSFASGVRTALKILLRSFLR